MKVSIQHTASFIFKDLLFFSIFLISTLPVFSEKVKKVAVLDFTPVNTDKTVASAVRNIFEVSLYKTGKFKLLERNKIERVINKKGLELTVYTNPSTMAKMGKAMYADIIITGTVNKIDEYTITVKFIDVNTGNVILADFITSDSEKNIQSAVKHLCRRMTYNYSKGTMIKDNFSDFKNKKKSTIEHENRLSIMSSLFIPIGKFSDVVRTGFGLNADYTVRNLLIQNLFFGLESGLYYLPGKKNNIKNSTIIPLLFTTGYIFNFNNFYMGPVISLGAGYGLIYEESGRQNFLLTNVGISVNL